MDENTKNIGKTVAFYGVVACIVLIVLFFTFHGTAELFNSIDSDDKEPTYYTVSYDLNGGTGYCPEPVIVAYWGSVNVDVSDPPSKYGYVFNGWSTDPAATSGYKDKDSGPWLISSDTTLYATWQPLITGSSKVVPGYENGFSYKSKYIDYMYSSKPNRGYQYYVIEITVTNHSYSSGYIPDCSDFEITCSNSLMYTYDTSSSSFNTNVMGKSSIYDIKIAKGGTYSFYLVYEIPSDCTVTSLKYSGTSWGYTWQWA